MQPSCVIFVLCLFLVHTQAAHGIRHRNFLNEASLLEDSSVSATEFLTSSDIVEETSDLFQNSSELRADGVAANESDTSPVTDGNNSSVAAVSSDRPQTGEVTSDSVVSSSALVNLTESHGNESQATVSSSLPHASSDTTSGSSGVSGGVSTTSTAHSVASSATTRGVNGSSVSTEDGEPEGVARGKPPGTESVNVTVPEAENLYRKTLALISDTYTLSIVVPIAAGVVFASTILVMVAFCRCMRKKCRRRRLHRKTALPDSVKNLRPSDRARLLAESSDEEF